MIFVVVRQKGGHISLQKIIIEEIYIIVVPLHRRLAKGKLIDILHQTGLSKEKLIDLF
jgi:predicted RNA binding protein YcfA (HicA-like mRNA interferase family)